MSQEFRYVARRLYCEEVPLEEVAWEVGTPFYLYSYRAIIEQLKRLRDAFSLVNPLICYSLKANSNLAICRIMARQGCGADVVSGGELYRALKAGIPPDKVVYAGVGKRKEEIEYALKNRIKMFNVESLPELDLIDRVGVETGQRASVSLRINPDVSPSTHHYIKTGGRENKFGLGLEEAQGILEAQERWKQIKFLGLHIHIGSQILEISPYLKALEKVHPLIEFLKEKGENSPWLNLGGGMGIVYDQEKPFPLQEYAGEVNTYTKRWGCRIILEPGRFLVGNSGVLVTRVIYVKERGEKKFIIVDAGMNDLLRPALYSAHHRIFPVEDRGGETEEVDVVGPICESGDYFALNRKLPRVEPNALLAIMSTGAYGFSMSSTYNSRPRVAEVLVKEGNFYLIRERETYQDLVRGEKIPSTFR